MGKSLLFQAVPVLVPNSVAIIVLPLDKIGQEQVEKLRNLGSKLDGDLIRPIFVNADSKSVDPRLFEDIMMLKYTHVFIGPEQAVSPGFGDILKEPNFKTKVSLVAIDEAHLVGKWGAQFRQSYAQLGLVRSRLGRACKAAWFACSATLDGKSLEALRKGAHFAHDVHHIRGSINRTDISFSFQPIPKGKMRSFEALRFTIDECKDETSHPSPQKIPKTIIFVDSRKTTREMVKKLKRWIQILCPEYTRQQLNMVINRYHRNTGAKEKERIYAEFSKPDSQIRIVVATESLGLGVDLNDIRRVVQYGFPLQQDLDTIMQRFGRVARAMGIDGEALLLYEHWAVPPEAGIHATGSQMQAPQATKPSALQEQDVSLETIAVENEDAEALNALPSIEYAEEVATQNAEVTQQKRKSENERRAQLPEVLRELIDASIQGRCLREIINQYYEEWRAMESTKSAPPPKERCCSSCNPALIPSSEPLQDSDEDAVKLQPPRRWALPDLEAWCAQQAAMLYPGVPFTVPTEAYLDDRKIKKLANACFDIKDVTALKTIVGMDWPFFGRDGQRLVDTIEATAMVVEERWNKKSKERSTRNKQALLQRASQTPFEELNRRQNQLNTDHEELVARLNNIISHARSTQTSDIQWSDGFQQSDSFRRSDGFQLYYSFRRSDSFRLPLTPNVQPIKMSASLQASATDSTTPMGCDAENSSPDVTVVSPQSQIHNAAVDPQPVEASSSSQPVLAESLASSMATFSAGNQHPKSSFATKKRTRCGMEASVQKRVRASEPAKPPSSAPSEIGTSGARVPLGVLDVNVAASLRQRPRKSTTSSSGRPQRNKTIYSRHRD
jgi:superfamily II DNA helicase RecQ